MNTSDGSKECVEEGGLDWPQVDEAGDGYVVGRQSLFALLFENKLQFVLLFLTIKFFKFSSGHSSTQNFPRLLISLYHAVH